MGPLKPFEQNRRTQPINHDRVFNRWDAVAKGWYVAFASRDLAKGQIRPLEIAEQRIVLFRGEDGKVRALDSFCPHMGTDFAVGSVKGNRLRCFFHHWEFAGTGECVKIPCQDHIPQKARTRSYSVEEKFGFIWVYPDTHCPVPLTGFDEYASGEELEFSWDPPYERTCHHHVCMINGLDPQHLRTVHALNVEMGIETKEDDLGRIIRFDLQGEVPKTSFKERLARKLLGSRYGYAMKYADGCIGFLTLAKHTRLFATGPKFPELTMIFAYRPLPGHRTHVQPIYVTKKRHGLTGKLVSKFLLALTRRAFYALQGEDGKVYDNIRFSTSLLLPIDKPLGRYKNHIEKLALSDWGSRTEEESGRIEAPKGRSEYFAPIAAQFTNSPQDPAIPLT